MVTSEDIEKAEKIKSPDSFQNFYNKIIIELDLLHRGVFDETEAQNYASLCLMAQISLSKLMIEAEHRSRSLKRDIDFAKAEAYAKLREKKFEGKKLAETGIQQMINKEEEVARLYKEQNQAEREAKDYANIMAILKDAHILFRALIKRGA